LVWSRTEFPCGCARTWLSQTGRQPASVCSCTSRTSESSTVHGP
jgi:hypothetical protein